MEKPKNGGRIRQMTIDGESGEGEDRGRVGSDSRLLLLAVSLLLDVDDEKKTHRRLHLPLRERLDDNQALVLASLSSPLSFGLGTTDVARFAGLAAEGSSVSDICRSRW